MSVGTPVSLRFVRNGLLRSFQLKQEHVHCKKGFSFTTSHKSIVKLGTRSRLIIFVMAIFYLQLALMYIAFDINN